MILWSKEKGKLLGYKLDKDLFGMRKGLMFTCTLKWKIFDSQYNGKLPLKPFSKDFRLSAGGCAQEWKVLKIFLQKTYYRLKLAIITHRYSISNSHLKFLYIYIQRVFIHYDVLASHNSLPQTQRQILTFH